MKPVMDSVYVAKAQVRLSVLNALQESPKTPTQIADEYDHQQTHVSRALSRLEDRDLVICKTSHRKGRYYHLTDSGKNVAATLTQ